MTHNVIDLGSDTDLAKAVAGLMPGLWRDLADLVRIPSVFPSPDVAKARQAIVKLFQEAHITEAGELSLTHQGKPLTPLVYADKAGPVNSPTVLLYAHYDVQPANKAGWHVTEPFAPKEVLCGTDKRLYGRGAADDKSGVMLHLAVARAFGGKLPVHLKLMLEGEEENGTGLLEDYLIAHPDDQRFKADLIIVADTGNVALARPTVTTTLRGVVTVDVTVHTLRKPVHSGMYGGPVPDAFTCLVRMLSTLHDANGDVAVKGLAVDDLPWPAVDETRLHEEAAMLDGVRFVGTGTLAQRLYGKASVNVVGLDAGLPQPNKSANVLRDKASARISMRTAPTQDPAAAQRALIDHLKAHVPWGVQVETTPGITAYGFSANPNGTYFPLVEQALKAAYPGSVKVERAGQGGSIPLVHAFQVVNPNADIVLWGCEEPKCGIHGPDESVSHAELQAMATAEVLLLDRIGKAGHHNGGAM